MGTASPAHTDEQLQREVLDELTDDDRLRSSEVGVTATEGVVALTGRVDSVAKKRAAEQAAQRVGGVRAVADDIEVRHPGWAEQADPDIALAVERALEWHSLLPADAVRVTVSDGRVTLRGAVEWEYQKWEAERTVRRLTGVTEVRNHITVQP